ncbi:unnamed protein product [Parnassius mnemosyne]|uniref:Peptidase A2B Ty3 transposon peptidase domain-containing protein n=1 Tax=Parnassius mnemosyne TaxID=213953 RepID=A0AAV1KWG3_9NEOP
MDGEQIRTLVRKRASIKGTLTKIENMFKNEEDYKEFSKQALVLKEERLHDTFKKYEDYTLEICAIDPDLDDGDDVEEQYSKTLTVIRELLETINCEKSCKNECVTKSFNTKLPTINVPTYSGKYSEFKPFIQLFDSLIHNNQNLDDVQKFFYLRSFLREEPHDLVKNLTLSTESYHEARKILVDRYDNKYKITNEHIHILLDIVPICKSTASNLRNFVSIVKQQLAALKNLGHSVDQWDPIVLCILTRKLDLLCSREFQLARVRDPTVAHLINFLDKRALALENAVRPPERSQPTSKVAHVAAVKKTNPDTGAAAETVGTRSCLLCKSNHKLFTCPQFKLMSASDRIKFATSNKLCEVCLNNHSKKCRYHFKCNVCKEGHNTLLHEDKASSPVTLMSEAASEQVLLPTAQVKLLASNGTEVHVKALLDTGSQASFVTRELANLLKLQIDTANTPVIGIGNTLNKLKEKVHLEIHSLTQNFKISVTCYLLDKITSKLPQRKFDLHNIVLPSKIMLADKRFNEPSDIHILLGADIFFQILLPPEPELQALPSSSEAPDGSVTPKAPLLNTRLGYVIAGNTPTQHTEPVITLFCKKCDSDLNNSIVKFWKCESVPETFPEAHSENDLCEKIFCDNVEQDTKNNKIQVILPLKLPLDSINQALGDSLYLALKRFHNLEHRFKKDSNLFMLYKEFIHEYLKQKHGTLIDISQYNLCTDPVCFLPHHPVLRLDKKTKKCRVVFDGSMKTSTKTSLNDLLLNGPVVQKELVDVLMLFRVDEYFFITDIKNMFRNINIHLTLSSGETLQTKVLNVFN